LKLLLFDLGGVLINDSSIQSLYNLTDKSLPIEFIRNKWINFDPLHFFESGKNNEELFANNVINCFHLKISANEFIDNYYNWPVGFYDGVTDLLLNLKSKYSLGFLSNSNSIHYRKVVNDFKILNYFDYTFSSHLLGFLKPNIEIYESVVKQIPFAKNDVAFFDDKEENVTASNNYGIKSYGRFLKLPISC
jgi:glucose-1-phosphatase